MIKTHALSHTFGSTPCLKNVNLDVEQGSILGFLGPNGAGKTTTIRVLTGLLRPTQGWASVNGIRVDQDLNALRKILGYLPEEAPAYPEMRIEEFLGFVAGLKELPAKEIRRNVEQTLDQVDLLKDRRRIIGNISKGMRRRVGLAQALLGNPKVLILDEPTDGLDPAQIALVRELICSLKEKCTVFFSTHILPNVIETCSHVAILSQGRLISQGTIAEIESSRQPVLELSCARGMHNENPLVGLLKSKGLTPTKQFSTATSWVVHVAYYFETHDWRNDLLRSCLDQGLEMQEMKILRPSLEEIFLKAISSSDSGNSTEQLEEAS